MPRGIRRQRGSTSLGTSPRYAVASCHSCGVRSGSLRVSSCSRCATLADVDLLRQVAADRCFERLARHEVAAGERPAPGERILRPLPEQHLEHACAGLKDHREADVSRGGVRAGKLAHSFRPIVANLSGRFGMKRSLVLLGVVALLVAGCGGGDNKSSSGTTTSQSGSGSGKKIGLVTDIGGLNDRGFNHLSYVGLQRAAERARRRAARVPGALDAGVRPEPVDVRTPGLQPDDRRRLHRGDGDRHGRDELPELELRHRRRRHDRGAAQAEESARPALQGAGDRLSRRLSRRARGEATPWPRRASAPSAARSSRRSTASSPATRRARRPPIRASSCSTPTRRTSPTRRSASRSR